MRKIKSAEVVRRIEAATSWVADLPTERACSDKELHAIEDLRLAARSLLHECDVFFGDLAGGLVPAGDLMTGMPSLMPIPEVVS